MYCCDLTRPNKAIRGNRTRDIKILIFSRGVEKQDFEGLLWGPIDPRGTIQVEKAGPMAQ